jgi:single-stranded DNA-binding protein
MSNYNSIVIVGNVYTFPELVVEEPLTVKLKVVTSEKYFSKKKNELINTSEYHVVKLWKQNARFALDFLNIGDKVLIEGRLHYHLFKDENSKVLGKNAEILANLLKLMDRRGRNYGERGSDERFVRGDQERAVNECPPIEQVE